MSSSPQESPYDLPLVELPPNEDRQNLSPSKYSQNQFALHQQSVRESRHPTYHVNRRILSRRIPTASGFLSNYDSLHEAPKANSHSDALHQDPGPAALLNSSSARPNQTELSSALAAPSNRQRKEQRSQHDMTLCRSWEPGEASAFLPPEGEKPSDLDILLPQPKTPQHSKQCPHRLLRLPPELRNTIFDMAVLKYGGDGNLIIFDGHQRKKLLDSLHCLQINKQMRHELSAIFWGRHTFRFSPQELFPTEWRQADSSTTIFYGHHVKDPNIHLFASKGKFRLDLPPLHMRELFENMELEILPPGTREIAFDDDFDWTHVNYFDNENDFLYPLRIFRSLGFTRLKSLLIRVRVQLFAKQAQVFPDPATAEFWDRGFRSMVGSAIDTMDLGLKAEKVKVHWEERFANVLYEPVLDFRRQ